MSRHTQEQVDIALESVADGRFDEQTGYVLADEVQALRADVIRLHGAYERVKHLCFMQHEDSAVSVGDIRAALRGSTP